MEKRKTKCLITGALGFVGTNLCKRLIEEGYDVLGIDNMSIGTYDNLIDGVTYLYWDVEDQIDFIKGSNIDMVYHLAALSRIQPSFENPTETFRVNTSGVDRVCNWALENNVKMIYAGSSSRWHDPFQSPYATSKKLGEDICKMYKKVYNLNVEICRFYNVYGPYEITDGKWATVIGKWRGQVSRGEPITIVGDGEQRRDFTHIDDIIEGLMAIGFGNYHHEDGWELGTGSNYSLNELSEMFIEKFECGREYIPNQRGNYRNAIRVNDDMLNRIGWKPTDKLKQYINDL
jgi:UDP-glucose 4-epimerase